MREVSEFVIATTEAVYRNKLVAEINGPVWYLLAI